MSYLMTRGDAGRLPFPDQSIDLVIGSPPYVDARLYLEDGEDLGIARGLEEWVEWMLAITAEALRVSKGCVIWVAAGKTEDRNYWPACEGLMWEWWKRGGHAYRPVYWNREGIPGSGGDQWFKSSIEHCMCFKRPGPLPWTDNTASGEPPKCPVGGAPSYRNADGARINQKKGRTEFRALSGYKNGDAVYKKRQAVMPDLCNPGNLLRTLSGGGHCGHPAAHENEAPFPVAVPEFFIKSLCPPGGITLDPFSGSGSSVEAAVKNGRHGIGLDLRMSQANLASLRLDRPHAPLMKKGKPKFALPALFDE